MRPPDNPELNPEQLLILDRRKELNVLELGLLLSDHSITDFQNEVFSALHPELYSGEANKLDSHNGSADDKYKREIVIDYENLFLA